MSDTEQDGQAAPPEATPAAEDAEVPAEDAATSTSAPKERVKRLQRPDDAQLKAETGSLNEKIQQAKARVEEIKELISSKQGNRGGSAEQQAVKEKLSDLRNQFQQELKEKQRIRQELDSHRAVREQLTKQQREMKTKCEYLTVDQVDEAIARLEQRMTHTSMSLNEEKKAIEDIKRLKGSRSIVAQHAQRVQQLSVEANSNSKNDIMDRLKDSDARLADIKAQEDSHRGQLASIRAKEDAQTADIPSLIQERNDQQALVKAAYSKIVELREEHRQKFAAWRAVEDAFYAQRREDYLKRKEQQQREWEERQAERKKRDADMAGEPFDREVTLCEQLHAHLSKFAAADAEASVSSAPAASTPGAVPDGYRAVGKKKDEELGGFFALGGKGGGKKGKKKGASEAQAAKPAPQKLTHSLDMINAFAALKVDVPVTASQVPPSLEVVAQRKAHFLEKRRKVKANEEVQDADWERSNGAASSSKASGSSAKPTANGSIQDMSSWPAIAGSHQIVEDDEPQGAKEDADTLSGALANSSLEEPSGAKADSTPDGSLQKANSVSVALTPREGEVEGIAVAMTCSVDE